MIGRIYRVFSSFSFQLSIVRVEAECLILLCNKKDGRPVDQVEKPDELFFQGLLEELTHGLALFGHELIKRPNFMDSFLKFYLMFYGVPLGYLRELHPGSPQ